MTRNRKGGRVMADKIIIYGKNTWPYTRSAREAYQNENRQVEYIDVISDADKLDEMLRHSKGVRKVPVILDEDTVTIGFNGGSWGI